ncbi:MAG: ABC transporter ATP-binding protein [Marinilabiliales bacterium]|nr:MAG: ABC transporter ATP-binding protein [Marinilabiliales bacterium]
MLNIQNLNISFKSNNNIIDAVKSVSFEIAKGDTLGIVGESGSGKSVTAMAIMRLLAPQAIIKSGIIEFEGEDILKMNNAQIRNIRAKKISMIFQEPMTSLNPVMKCGKQMAEVFGKSGLTKKEIKEQIVELFKKVKLPRPEKIYSSYPHQLSGGQKQRVMIAMAIANKPDLLIADEPTTALDVRVQKDLILLLKQLKDEYGMSLLFISHDLGLVSEIVSHVMVMYKGEIVERGSIKQVFNNPKHNYTKGLLACRPPVNEKPARLKTIDEFISGSTNIKDAFEQVETKADFTEKILKIEGLNKRFVSDKNFRGKATSFVNAVDDVSFEVFKGETLGLVGESGCGKTTLSRSILRLIDVESGKIFFDEEDVLGLKSNKLKKYRKNMNIVFQDPYSSLNPRISIGKAIGEPLKVFGIETSAQRRKQKVMELLEKVGLHKDSYFKYPHEFSGGQRQRVVIARALALNPRFLICDEAVSALDVSVQAKVLNLLNDLKREFGFTYIFISHDLNVVKYMSDRIMVMKDGKIVEIGSADEVYNSPKQEYTRQLIEAIPGIS